MALTIRKPLSQSEAAKVSTPTLLADGIFPAEFREAVQRKSQKRRDIIDITTVVLDTEGNEREFHIYLHDSPLCALLLRNTCEAVGALDAYERGAIEAALFPGHRVRVVIGTERKRGWPPRNVILNVLEGVVMPLRQAG